MGLGEVLFSSVFFKSFFLGLSRLSNSGFDCEEVFEGVQY